MNTVDKLVTTGSRCDFQYFILLGPDESSFGQRADTIELSFEIGRRRSRLVKYRFNLDYAFGMICPYDVYAYEASPIDKS